MLLSQPLCLLAHHGCLLSQTPVSRIHDTDAVHVQTTSIVAILLLMSVAGSKWSVVHSLQSLKGTTQMLPPAQHDDKSIVRRWQQCHESSLRSCNRQRKHARTGLQVCCGCTATAAGSRLSKGE